MIIETILKDLMQLAVKRALDGWFRGSADQTLSESLKQLLKLELAFNLGLLAKVDDAADQRTIGAKHIALALKSDALDACFTPGAANRLLFDSLGNIPVPAEEEDDDSGPTDGKSVIVALRSLHVRIRILRVLANIEPDCPGLKPVRLRTRLKNIRKLVGDVLRVLESD